MAEIVDFGLQQHKIKMDSRYFENVLSVVAGDTGRRVEVQLLDTNGMVQDTTGLNLRLNAEIAGKATFTDATLVDATTGKYQLDLSNGMFLAPGNWQFQWQITDSAGKKLHSFAFTGNIGKNISEGGSQATNFYLNLEDLKAMQDDLINGTIESSILETNIAGKLTDLEMQYAPKLTEVTKQLADTARKLSGFYSVKDFKCDDGKYVQGDGIHDDTTGIQRAMDSINGGVLSFPHGAYKVTESLQVNTNVSLLGGGPRDSRISGVGLSELENLIDIKIKNNDGNLDVRNWYIRGLGFGMSTGGKHGIYFHDQNNVFPILTSSITNCGFYMGTAYSRGGYDVYIENNFAHSIFELNTFYYLYLQCGDANIFRKNTSFGERAAYTFNLKNGVRNNSVNDNTIVNRDGAVIVLNGNEIRIVNNQMEVSSTVRSESETKSLVHLKGVDRPCTNVVISENNFGGGTNVDYLVYIDNAEKTVIEKNKLISPYVADFYITEKARNTIIKGDNHISGTQVNPRTGTSMVDSIVHDFGYGTVGAYKKCETANGWENGRYVKDEYEMVNFVNPLKNGTTNAGDTLFTLPKGFRPPIKTPIIAYTNNNIELLQHAFNGKVVSKTLTNNSKVLLSPFACDTSRESDNNYVVYDDFEGINGNSVTSTETGQAWVNTGSPIVVTDNAASMPTKSNGNGFLITNVGLSDYTIETTFEVIPTTIVLGVRLVFRYVDDLNYLYLAPNDVSGYDYSIYSVVNGVETRLNGYFALDNSFANGDKVKVVLNGESITAHVVGKTINATSNNFLTSTKQGISFTTTEGKVGDFLIY